MAPSLEDSSFSLRNTVERQLLPKLSLFSRVQMQRTTRRPAAECNQLQLWAKEISILMAHRRMLAERMKRITDTGAAPHLERRHQGKSESTEGC